AYVVISQRRSMCGRRFLVALVATVVLISPPGCKQEGGVKVNRFKLNGVNSINDKQLKGVIATAPSSKLPTGDNYYFKRAQVEADDKRSVAFYQDRGFPDARVTSFDVKLSEDQNSVDIVVKIDEGQPIRAEGIVLEGIDALPQNHRQTLENGIPLK